MPPRTPVGGERQPVWERNCVVECGEDRYMNEQPMDKRLLAKFAGLGAGIMIGGPMGPIVFGVTGLNDPTSATLGSCLGPVLGYVIVALVLHPRQRRIDQELLHAAEAVKAAAPL